MCYRQTSTVLLVSLDRRYFTAFVTESTISLLVVFFLSIVFVRFPVGFLVSSRRVLWVGLGNLLSGGEPTWSEKADRIYCAPNILSGLPVFFFSSTNENLMARSGSALFRAGLMDQPTPSRIKRKNKRPNRCHSRSHSSGWQSSNRLLEKDQKKREEE